MSAAEFPHRHESIEVAAARHQVWHNDSQVRAVEVEETLRGVAEASLVSVAGAVGLLVSFWSSPDLPEVAILLVFAICVAGAAGIALGAGLLKRVSPRGTRIGLGVMSGLAALTAMVWGAVPIVLFAGSDADHGLVVLAAVVLVMASVHRLGAIPRAGLLFMTPICVGSAIGFAIGGSLMDVIVAVTMPLFGWLLLSPRARVNAATARHIVDQVSIAEQNDTIHGLLLDFDEDTSDWLWRTDSDGRLTNVSDGAGRAAGLPINKLEGAKFETVFVGRGASTASNGIRAVSAAFAARKPFRNQVVEIAGDDKPRCWRLSGKPVFDDAGGFHGYRGVGSDMTEVLNAESRMTHLANFDTLTGFANRANFQAYVGRQCVDAVGDGRCRALLCVDLDDFKSVNDSLGHDGGDELLRQVAARLTRAAPADAFIGRLGADEFAIWVQPTTPAKAESVASHIIETLGAPFEIDGRQIDVGASIGIAFAPKHATDPHDLLVKADLALYSAKADSKGKACVFTPAFETVLIERRKLDGDLKLALARGEFTLNYQPIVDMSLGRIVSFEALIRWHSPDRGQVSPDQFIPAAERCGLIAPIGRWVLFEACKAATAWPRDVHVAVNVSPPHLRSPGFLQDVVVALQMSGLHPSRLEIEVTEGVLLDKGFSALDTLRTLRTRGVRIALDDFGTGYSSFNYLIDFPVDKIKIDRSFVRDFTGSPANQAIVDAILGLARKLSIRVTAEGVETKEQALALRRRRCDEIQGYLMSRPRPGSDVPDMIASVPGLFREAVPTYTDSPLAMAFTAKKQAV
jgi:diguanylate cyclase (GGDEF)-like protein